MPIPPTYPGVYVEEIASGSKPIEGVATSTAAFVGITQRNSNHDPVLIGGINDFTDLFGPILTTGDAMGLAVQAYYRNGGGAAYICPLSTASVTGTKNFGEMTISAKGDGPWSDFLYIKITRVGASDFDMEVGTRNNGGTFYSIESFEKVTLDASLESYAETRINGVSAYVTAVVTGTGLPVLTNVDGDGDGNDDGEVLENGAQTSPAAADYASFYAATLRKIRAVSIIVLPGQSWAADGSGNAVISETRAHCDKMKNRIVLIDTPQGHETQAKAEVQARAQQQGQHQWTPGPTIDCGNQVCHHMFHCSYCCLFLAQDIARGSY